MVNEMIENRKSESIKVLCSYGGKILPRRSDGKLRYVGGYTRVLSIDRSISYSELMVKLFEFCGFSVTLKCQLPDGDFDTLVSLKSDEDLANIVEAYDRVSSSRPQKIRAVLAPTKPLKKDSLSNSSSIASSLDKSPIYGDRSPRQAVGECCSRRSSSPTFSFPVAYRAAAVDPHFINRCHHYVHRAPRVLCTPSCCNYARLPGRRLHTH